MIEHDSLTDADRHKVAAMVDHFVSILCDRYNTTPQEILDAVRWVRDRKEQQAKWAQAGFVSLIGMIVSAGILALWEGIKMAIRGGH